MDLARERRFEFPASDENRPPQGFVPVAAAHRKRMGQLGVLAAFNDLRSAYTDDGDTFPLQ